MKLGVLCYIQFEKKTLMLYRNKKENDIHQGKWNGLGGKLEPGESPEEALHREVKEESGLEIHHPRFRGMITFPCFKDLEDWYVYLFSVNQFSGTMIDCPEGELHWINDDKIHDLNLWEGDHLFFDWLKQENFFSAKIVYRDQRLVDHQVKFY